jgi:hypothetical protein
MHRIPILVALVSLATSCALPHTVRTAGAGRTVLHASLGGPLVDNLGAPVPVPAVVVTAQHGLTDAWDLYGSFHVLPAVFGNLGIDFGTTRRLMQQRRAIPEWTLSLRVSFLTDFTEARAYPEVESHVSWIVGRRWLLYAGLHTLWDFFHVGDTPGRVLWGPVLGADVRFGRRWAFGLALRWVSPQEDTGRLVVGHAAPGHLGMFFVQLGLRVSLPSWGGDR